MIRLAFVVALLVSPAAAQIACYDYSQVTARLATIHGEVRSEVGVDDRGILELWRNPATGTFTVLIHTPEGLGCPLAAGEHWRSAEPLPKGDPA